MLLVHAIQKFLHYLTSLERSEQTTSGYEKDLKLFSRFLEKKYNCSPYLEEVTAADIEDYLLWLKEERNYAPASRARNLYTLRSFFAYAYKKELVARNVALSVENIKTQQKERVYLSEEEVQQLVGAIDHDLIRLVVQVLYLTGLRISECLDLTLDTVDLERKVIHVVAGKGNKDRIIPISDKLLPLLRHYVEHERPDTDSDLFFCTKKTGKLSPVYVNRVLADAVEKLGWKKKVTAHILRHSFASQLVKKEVNLVQIQKLLGHSSLKVTSIYTHSNLEQLSEAVNAL
ncbi:tyrosine-type recombinase/integrase [Brevibacillus agri]|uniref:tyrosine-type recombinase/integrase n=1 Tax=Brevibacillus agri TaxID=51101 RepID=UPI001C8E516F|nr:tyrosine-type recombinase/integrase [Brevibacillus agri]MBY0054921.1 tyrosine-type recombinase/integrase [Brevibacillus agri]